MSRPTPSGTSHPPLRWRVLAFLGLVLLPVINLYGDVPARLQNVSAAGCYCRCHEAFTRRGCTKMCDRKKSAVQWFSISCMKPRFQPPPDKSGAGPHLHHPDHAEHAQLVN
ncbi:MAG TPA: hypothetical protein VGH83_04470 [Candidatus Acidoferrum sp.]